MKVNTSFISEKVEVDRSVKIYFLGKLIRIYLCFEIEVIFTRIFRVEGNYGIHWITSICRV